MRRRKKILAAATLLLLAASIAWHWQAARGPVYAGRHTADWVAEALQSDSATNAQAMILQIGAPAVPFIASQGLYGRSHVFHFLATDRLRDFSRRHNRTSVWLDLRDWDYCVPRHERARRLLLALGTDARAAIPDLINCLEQCPELNFASTLEFQDTLAQVNGTNSAALHYFTRCARTGNDLHAAALAYKIDSDTNLFVEVANAVATNNPISLAETRDLSWFRDDHPLNKYVVPLLEKIYSDPKLNAPERAEVMDELASRGIDASNAIARIQAAQIISRPAP